MWIKICANTNLDDCLAAIDFGADALGFVFAPSARQVTPAQVAAIATGLPDHVERVGVFASSDAGEIARAAEQAALTTIQLHGGMDLALAHRLRSRLGSAMQIIATTAWKTDAEGDAAARVAGDLRSAAEDSGGLRVLVDAQAGGVSGGLGIGFDWSAAGQVFSQFRSLRIIAAGGLRPDNVAEAIRQLNPWGVDVASGVEREKGRKDLTKLKAFVEAARSAALPVKF